MHAAAAAVVLLLAVESSAGSYCNRLSQPACWNRPHTNAYYIGCFWVNGACSSIEQLGGGVKRGCPVNFYSSPCEYVNCLVKPQDVCGLPTAGSGNSTFAPRHCLWSNGRCHASVATAELPSNLVDQFAAVVEDDAKGLRQCGLAAMQVEGLTATRSDFGCGASVLSPDCIGKVSALGNLVQQCAKTKLTRSMQTYYDTELEYIVDGTKEVYDCTAEGVKTCAFSARAGGFCGPARRVKWEVPSTADAQACLADYSCLAQVYNTCAKQKAFVPATELPDQTLPEVYPRILQAQTCLEAHSGTCGGTVAEVMDACLKFTDVVACAANLRCYAAFLGQCGKQNDLWSQQTADEFVNAGPTMMTNARCFAEKLQDCGFEKEGFCSSGKIRDATGVLHCLRDVACMARAVAPCQVGEAALEVALVDLLEQAEERLPQCHTEYRWRGEVGMKWQCSAYCRIRFPTASSKCDYFCRAEGLLRCQLFPDSGRRPDMVVTQFACLSAGEETCDFNEKTFCKIAGATPTDAEAAACQVQTKCAAKALWRCTKLLSPDFEEAADAVSDAAVKVYDKHTNQTLDTRTCIEAKEALCGAKMSDLGFNSALCLASPSECKERARCMFKEAHKCGEQTGFLQSAAQQMLESTGYTRCMLAEFQGTDLALKIADLDYDFFFNPTSTKLMEAHAKCAGWPLSKLRTILPTWAVDPARRQISSVEFCGRSITSICEPFAFDEAASAVCALVALYRCRDGTSLNKHVDACFTDAAGECGAVKGRGTWANVQDVDCVNDAGKCAKMATCLTIKVVPCLGRLLGQQGVAIYGDATQEVEKVFGGGPSPTAAQVPVGPSGGCDGGGVSGWVVVVAAVGGFILALAVVGAVLLLRRPAREDSGASFERDGEQLKEWNNVVAYAQADEKM